MSIIGMSLARNEEDIIRQSLQHAARQVDLILVVDCGSIDDTSSEIEKVCEEFNHVVFLGKLPAKHPHQVRRHIWSKFFTYLNSNDWWIYIDADEFPAEDLREKVKLAEREYADQIWGIYANFYYTAIEAEDWYSGRETLADRSKPIWERRQFYRMHIATPRLFRNLPWIRWQEDSHWPKNLSKPAREGVIYRHYQYRDIPQIEMRIKTRNVEQFNQNLTKQDPHWNLQQVDECISKHDPTLRKVQSGQPLEPDPTLPSLPEQGLIKSMLKYSISVLKGVQPQEPSLLFEDIDPQLVISRIKRP